VTKAKVPSATRGNGPQVHGSFKGKQRAGVDNQRRFSNRVAFFLTYWWASNLGFMRTTGAKRLTFGTHTLPNRPGISVGGGVCCVSTNGTGSQPARIVDWKLGPTPGGPPRGTYWERSKQFARSSGHINYNGSPYGGGGAAFFSAMNRLSS